MVKRTNNQPKNNTFFERIAMTLTRFSGGTSSFVIAFTVIILWACTGPFFNFSETWQLVINTGTTIITFLMVFLIQRAQNKDSMAIQLKLNEIIASVKGASNLLIDAEDLSEKELAILKKHYDELSKLVKIETDVEESHSIEEAIKKP
ncbi:MAG: low affinity iron permease family protein [bacterium]|nr:low affinity iron permease family protein [bacterium]